MKLRRSARLTACSALIVVGLTCVAAFATGIRPTVTDRVPGVGGALGYLTCPPTGLCVATGTGNRRNALVVAAISREGRVKRVVTVPGGSYPTGVACPTADFCMALNGVIANGAAQTWLIPIRRGIPAVPRVVPRSAFSSISCGSPSSCWAFGYTFGADPTKETGRAAHIVNGRIVRFYKIPLNYSGSGTCFSATHCLVLGNHGLATLDRGRVVKRSGFPYSSARPGGLGCQNSTTCTVIGYKTAGLHRQSAGAVVARVTDGQIGPLTPVRGLVDMSAIYCSPGVCFALGSTRNENGQNALVPIVNGTVETPISPTNVLDPVCTSAGSCLATGSVRGKAAVFKFRFPPG